MTAQPDVALISATATVRHLLTIATDAPACAARFAELDQNQKAVTAATTKYSARRDAFAERQREGRAKLAKLTAALAERRDSVEQEEGMFADAAKICAEQEREWAGLGLPADAPVKPDEDEE
jgi:septal ring factor EnvC (AmiA/AmiB activator)